MPSIAVPPALGAITLVIGALVHGGLSAAVFTAMAALAGWATGVLHERYI